MNDIHLGHLDLQSCIHSKPTSGGYFNGGLVKQNQHARFNTSSLGWERIGRTLTGHVQQYSASTVSAGEVREYCEDIDFHPHHYEFRPVMESRCIESATV